MHIILPIHHKEHLEQKPVIYQFQGDHRFLSNFWPCDIVLPAEGDLPAMQFNTVENAYMAWKTRDLKARRRIQEMTPGQAKRFSYTDDFVYRKNYTDKKRITAIYNLNSQKYSCKHPELLKKLMETQDALIIEGNIHCDTFFGFDLENGYGHNHLGRILMQIRNLNQQKSNLHTQ